MQKHSQIIKIQDFYIYIIFHKIFKQKFQGKGQGHIKWNKEEKNVYNLFLKNYNYNYKRAMLNFRI